VTKVKVYCKHCGAENKKEKYENRVECGECGKVTFYEIPQR